MKTSSLSVEQLAARLKDDIRRRRLAPRDKYFTSAEVGEAFCVSSVTAHRAMRMLAEDDILVRQRKVGTFVGEGALRHLPSQRGKIHLVVSEALGYDPDLIPQLLPSDLLAGLLDVLPDVSIQVDVVKSADLMSLVESIVDMEFEHSSSDGAVLVGAPAAVQQRFATSGIPAVAFGSLHPGVSGLASVDADQRRMGELTADYILNSGCRHAALCGADVYMPGNDAFLSGLLGGIQAGRSRVEIDHRSWSFEVDKVDQALRDLLSGANRPELLVARNATVARRVPEVVVELGLEVPEDLSLFIATHQSVTVRGEIIPGVERQTPPFECGRLLGQLLKAQQQREPIAEGRIVLPVELRKQKFPERERRAK